MPALIVHHLELSRSTRVLWLLAELAVEYELKSYKRDGNFRGPKTIRDLHPLGKSPLVEHEGRVFAESGAIFEYLLDCFDDGTLRPPPGTQALYDYRYWLHYAEGSLMSPLLIRLVLDRITSARVPFFVKPVAKAIVAKVEQGFLGPEIELHAEFLNASLQDREWFAGENFSAADIEMIFPVEALLARGRARADTRHLVRWRDACLERPAYRHALEQGGPLIPS